MAAPTRQDGAIERVSAYLDGFNIYNGLMARGWGRFRWLDYPTFLGRYMRDDQELVAVKYFTAPMMHQPDRYIRQKQYLQALAVRDGVVSCMTCNQPLPQTLALVGSVPTS